MSRRGGAEAIYFIGIVDVLYAMDVAIRIECQ